ncbi:MAG: hydrogenase maturation protease [Chlorobiaceae bacterium]|nr:hydrogenase maturation protease [Chlorobiaceae bacterium]NTV61353.1 hydrogenase maturation protease [Chlorobiaceae bacterium]
MTEVKYNRINVLGLGNVLYGDEGFGVEAVKSFQASADYPDIVQCIDGGTQGIYLLDYLESCDALIVFDALIPLEYETGVYVYRNDELPGFIHRKMSSHQMGFSELIGIARLQGRMPLEIALIGVPPRNLDLGIGLSSENAALLPEAVMKAKTLVDEWLKAFQF